MCSKSPHPGGACPEGGHIEGLLDPHRRHSKGLPVAPGARSIGIPRGGVFQTSPGSLPHTPPSRPGGEPGEDAATPLVRRSCPLRDGRRQSGGLVGIRQGKLSDESSPGSTAAVTGVVVSKPGGSLRRTRESRGSMALAPEAGGGGGSPVKKSFSPHSREPSMCRGLPIPVARVHGVDVAGDQIGPRRNDTPGELESGVVYLIPDQSPPAVRIVLGLRKHWIAWDPARHGPQEWDFQWRSGRFKPSEYRHVRPGQRLNHFPRSCLITRKDLLLRVLRKMRAVHGAVYAFHPESYMLPAEYTKFVGEFTRLQEQQRQRLEQQGKGSRRRRGAEVRGHELDSSRRQRSGDARERDAGKNDSERGSAVRREGLCWEDGDEVGDDGIGPRALWIVKPSDSSRGRGIYLLRDLAELRYDQPSVVQRYILDPLTLGGYKADLRLYAAVTSLHPMTVYLYTDGIVRFATAKYRGSSHDDIYGHLTNTSINRKSPFAATEKEIIGGGCKWSLKRLRHRIEGATEDGAVRWARLWIKVRSLVCLSVLPLADVVPGGPGHGSCFELFGFDIMVDSTMSRVSLLEVNCSPALGLDEPTDRQVKLPLISDLVDLVNMESASRAKKFALSEGLSREQEQPGYSRPLGPSCRDRRGSSERARGGPNASGPVEEIDRTQTESPREFREEREDSDRLGGTKGVAEDETTAFEKSTQASQRPPPRGLGDEGLGRANAASRGARSMSIAKYAAAAKGSAGSNLPPKNRGSSKGDKTEHVLGGDRKCGDFELVFPFGDESERQARLLSNHVRAGKAQRTQVQLCIRAIIAEIKAHESMRLSRLTGAG